MDITEHAKYFIHKFKQGRFSTKLIENNEKLCDFLPELYRNEAAKLPIDLFRPANLLDKIELIPNRLVVILNKDKYSVGVKLQIDGTHVEFTIYENSYDYEEFLYYVDNCLFVPALFDYLRIPPFNLLLCGWFIIAEIRDYRRNTHCKPKFTFLRPNTEFNLLAYNFLSYKKQNPYFESTVFLGTSDPLCFAPNPFVSVVTNRINFDSFLSEPCLRNSKIRKRALRDSSHGYIKRAKVNSLRLPPVDIVNDEEDKELAKLDFDLLERAWNENMPHNIWSNNIEYEKQVKNIRLDREVNLTVVDNQSMRKRREARITVHKAEDSACHTGTLSLTSKTKYDCVSSPFFLGTKLKVSRFVDRYMMVFTEQKTRAYEKLIAYPDHTKIVSSSIPGKSHETGMNQSKLMNNDSKNNSEKLFGYLILDPCVYK